MSGHEGIDIQQTNARVVITGIGPVSAVGTGWDEFSAGVCEGESGIVGISRFDPPRGGPRCAAELSDFDVEEYLESTKAYLDRGTELAFAATALALEDGAVDLEQEDRSAVGLFLGTAYGGLDTMALFFTDFLVKGPRLVKPFLFPHTYSNTAISLLAIEYGLSGPHLAFAAGGVSASTALVHGYDRIRCGRARMALAGGFESLSPARVTGLSRQGVLSPRDGRVELCAPFDETRNGIVLGEGAAVLVLEEREHALARGARIHAEITGAGVCADSRLCRENTCEPNGLVAAMQAASAGQPVDYICAAANGDPVLDANEAAAIDAAGLPSAVSSLKSMLGETGGAAGALHVAGAIAAMTGSRVPHTVGLTAPGFGAGLDHVMGQPRDSAVGRAVVNTVDRGGAVVSIGVAGPDVDI